MKPKRNSGFVVHSPLNDKFDIIPLGGSYVQKYDVMTDTYDPNRTITPLILKPELFLTCSDDDFADGDYTSRMVNVVWVLTLIENGVSTQVMSGYSYDASSKRLTINFNVEPDQILNVFFTGDYLDARRGDVFHYEKEITVSTERQSDYNLFLDSGNWRSKVRLSPFKNWGQFSIPVQLKHGNAAVDDADAVYQWQWWDADNNQWSIDFSGCYWYVGGKDTKSLTVDQDFIQNVLIRVKVYHRDAPTILKYFATRLKRWYGQFDYDVEFLTGKYIFTDTNMVVLNAWVANRQGNISQLSNYFDIELFFAVGNATLESVGYGEEVIVRRNDFQSGKPVAGILCRELSAFQPLLQDDGTPILEDNGEPIFVQVPLKTREIE